MVEYVRDHGDNRIVIEQHVDVGEDLHFSILDSNQQTIREKKNTLRHLPNEEQLD